MTTAEPCPCEEADPAGSPGQVKNEETLLHVVKVSTVVVWENGAARLSPAAFRNEDIEAKQKGKSISCMRDQHMSKEHMIARAKILNAEEGWRNDPVVAQAVVKNLRAIPGVGWREVCVFADPTDSSDRAGACPEHAAITRSAVNPTVLQKGGAPAMEKNKRRSAIAEQFGRIFHIVSGALLEEQ